MTQTTNTKMKPFARAIAICICLQLSGVPTLGRALAVELPSESQIQDALAQANQHIERLKKEGWTQVQGGENEGKVLSPADANGRRLGFRTKYSVLSGDRLSLSFAIYEDQDFKNPLGMRNVTFDASDSKIRIQNSLQETWKSLSTEVEQQLAKTERKSDRRLASAERAARLGNALIMGLMCSLAIGMCLTFSVSDKQRPGAAVVVTLLSSLCLVLLVAGFYLMSPPADSEPLRAH